ncbi:hypothetical protein P3T24_005107 [Paraburkholderia sp. GAS33]|jgi:hypothetical protein|uniref:hypothetical protein n=1 Tax=Paraburkholderia sp. GAS33 TaxID=3035130 RepID=UPI003D1A991E
MQIKKTNALTGVSLASIGLLAGCVQFVYVKDIASDKPAYLATHFSIESLPAGVLDKLPAPGTHTLPFKVLTMSGTFLGHVGTVTMKSDFKATLINAKTGIWSSRSSKRRLTMYRAARLSAFRTSTCTA